jgi:hypothetical protein
LRVFRLMASSFAVLALSGAPAALAASGGATPGGASTQPPAPTPLTPPGPTTGGAGVTTPPIVPGSPAEPTVAGPVAKIVDGVAYAPTWAPLPVQEAIWAGNRIRTKPYIWGGGHGSFNSRGYDCSGSVSYVLHAAGLLRTPMDSSDFYSWGTRGLGQWITVYTSPGHAFVEIAGIRLDTSTEGESRAPVGTAPGTGPRWRPLMKKTSGFQPRHLLGF